jgi:hypothetical protein
MWHVNKQLTKNNLRIVILTGLDCLLLQCQLLRRQR